MPTFKACIYADNLRADGTYNVKIRFTHRRQTLKVSTPLYVTKAQLTRGFKIKDQRIIDSTDTLIRRWRGYVADLGVKVEAMTARQLLDSFKERDKYADGFVLDFIDFGHSQLPKWGESTRRAYATALAAFERAVGHIDINAITPDTLATFERDCLKHAPKGTGRRYLSQLQTLYRLAQKQYNNPYSGEVKIPHSPFDYYSPTTVYQEPMKRAIPVEFIQRIIDFPRSDDYTLNLARDLWLLSFGLCGVNVADMASWNASQYDGEYISYYRRKIASRAGERAAMCIRVEPCIRELLERYMSRDGKRLLTFRRNLDWASRAGLPKIAKTIGWEGVLHQYSARHSWATIARNNCNIPLDVVNEALVHTDSTMKMTDVYIKRDYTRVWEANAKVLGLFDWANMLR